MRILRIDKKPMSNVGYFDAFAMNYPTNEDADNIPHKETIEGKVLLCK